MRSVHIEFDTDASIGARMRHRRWMLGMPQQRLGERMGVDLERVKVLEGGAHHFVAADLVSIAKALEVPVTYFSEAECGTDPDPCAPGLRLAVGGRASNPAIGIFVAREQVFEARVA